MSISLGLHLDLVFSGSRRMMASLKLRMPLSADFGNADLATRAYKVEAGNSSSNRQNYQIYAPSHPVKGRRTY
jgi:hypothetical protein